jgi:hypothetical protein
MLKTYRFPVVFLLCFASTVWSQSASGPQTFLALADFVNSQNKPVLMGFTDGSLSGVEAALEKLGKAGTQPRGQVCWGVDAASHIDFQRLRLGDSGFDEKYPLPARIIKRLYTPELASLARRVLPEIPYNAMADFERQVDQHQYYVGCEISLVDSYSGGSFGGGSMTFVVDTTGKFGFYLASYWFE